MSQFEYVSSRKLKLQKLSYGDVSMCSSRHVVPCHHFFGYKHKKKLLTSKLFREPVLVHIYKCTERGPCG